MTMFFRKAGIAAASLLATQQPAAAQTPATPPIATPPAVAASRWPTREGDFAIRDFRFRDGSTLPSLRMHYTTLGTPRRDASGRIANAVMVLHGTGGTGKQFLSPQFADTLYGPGRPLDISRYYIILPDNIGHGGSSKPSMAYACGSRPMIMTTWSPLSTGCSSTASECGSSGC